MTIEAHCLTKESYPRGKWLTSEIAITNPLGSVTSYVFNAVGNRESMTDAAGRTSSYGYDSLYRVISTTNALAGKT